MGHASKELTPLSVPWTPRHRHLDAFPLQERPKLSVHARSTASNQEDAAPAWVCEVEVPQVEGVQRGRGLRAQQVPGSHHGTLMRER